MIEFFYDFGLFLAKTVTLTGAVLIVVAIIARLAQRDRPAPSAKIKVKKLNDTYRKMERAIQSKLLSDDQLKAKQSKRRRKQKQSERRAPRRRRNLVCSS